MEGGNRLADFAEQLVLALQLVVAMGVEAADAGEEALTRLAERGLRVDQLGTICSC